MLRKADGRMNGFCREKKKYVGLSKLKNERVFVKEEEMFLFAQMEELNGL
jgi:hypothetical protein